VVDGLDDYIIVDKDNVLLIYPKSKEQDIKRITALATKK
jgi:mannose-1-phosphate guanylyltransferase